MHDSLHLGADDFSILLQRLGPSLGLWRAAEVAALRLQTYEPPVLDLGCGDGLVTSLVLPRIDMGVDLSPIAIARAAKCGTYGRLAIMPIEHLEAPSASVGTIISNSVLEHVANLSAVLAAAARLLRSGGRLIFTVPTEAFTRWLTLPSAHYSEWRNRHYEHRNLWPVDQWSHCLRQAGFTVLAVQPYLRRGLVTLWDALELTQRVWIGPYRAFGVIWRRLPPATLATLSLRLAALDLAAPAPGGGRLVVAQRH